MCYRRTTSRLFRAFFYYIKWSKSLNRAIIYTALVNILYSTIRLIVWQERFLFWCIAVHHQPSALEYTLKDITSKLNLCIGGSQCTFLLLRCSQQYLKHRQRKFQNNLPTVIFAGHKSSLMLQ